MSIAFDYHFPLPTLMERVFTRLHGEKHTQRHAVSRRPCLSPDVVLPTYYLSRLAEWTSLLSRNWQRPFMKASKPKIDSDEADVHQERPSSSASWLPSNDVSSKQRGNGLPSTMLCPRPMFSQRVYHPSPRLQIKRGTHLFESPCCPIPFCPPC